jgi:dissimilatory sulfite reductase related protein
MSEKTVGGKTVSVNEEGYFTDPSQWSEDMVAELGKEMEINEITPKHIEVINYLRDNQAKGVSLSLRKVGKSGIVDTKGFYTLFPGGPLKKSSFMAGIPKPISCV